MRAERWSLATAAEMAPLIADEVEAWRADLDWDVAREWREVEVARAAGRLPGLVVRDAAGDIAGWTFFLLHHGALQIAALSSRDAEATRVLVQSILASPVTAHASVVAASLRGGAIELAKTLASSGFSVADYGYWIAEPVTDTAQIEGLRPWRPSDLPATIDLCARAYSQISEVRAFAPLGTAPEWAGYVTELVHSSGCGRLLEDASFVVQTAHGSPKAVVLTTRISSTAAHIAQLVVEPDERRRGLATSLVRVAMASAARSGFGRMTLFVSDSNLPAARIYRRLGFRPSARFVVGVTAGVGQSERAASGSTVDAR